MIAVYCIAIFCYFYYFGIGYRRFYSDKYKLSKVGLVCSAILLRVFVAKFGVHNMVTYSNILVDLVIGAILYLMIKEHSDENKSLVGASFYLLNPVVIIYSCVWGNSLTLWIALLTLCIWSIKQEKILQACICFSIALYCYTGTIFLVPIFMVIISNMVRRKQEIKETAYAIGGTVIPFGALFVAESIFLKRQSSFIEGIKYLISSDRMSCNACNFWSMIGWNWKQISLNTNIRILIGIGIISLLVVGTIYFVHRFRESKLCYIVTALLIYYYGYFFGIGNRECIFLPIIILSLVYFLNNGSKKAYQIYFAVSILGFCNQIYAWSLYDPKNFNSVAPSIVLFSFCMLIALVGITKNVLTDQKMLMTWKEIDMKAEQKDNSFKYKEKKSYLPLSSKLELRDYLVMGIFTLVFIALSLPRLGSHVSPQTAFEMGEGKTNEIILDLGEEKTIDHLEIFLGQEHAIKINLSTYNNEKWQEIGEEQNVQSVFAWNEVPVNTSTRYLGVVTNNKEAYFNEMVIVGENGEIIEPINKQEYVQLFDEQELYKEYPTYYDQTFFDEVYHARTAYEYIIGDITYEITHPPLGKILISIGIRIFGMNPFGWRIVVELFGIAMIPLMYLFSKRIFSSFWTATMTTLLLTMDFMHFTLAKIATLDIIIGFFILLMYYFMYWYCQQDFMKVPLKKSFIPLGLCGVTMGVGIATKWTGVYAGAGLAVIFFTHIWNAYKVSIEHIEEKKACLQKIVKTFVFCIVFFIVIPIAIYCLSYIPFVGYREYNGLLDKVIDNMQLMYNYHSKLTATHPYGSWWYEWIWIKRPLHQAVTHKPDGIGCAISCFGNPLVWWTSIIAIVYLFKCWLWDRDKKAGFLCISYAAQLIPWMFVTRNTFIYHYFPSSLFGILMSGYCMHKIMAQYRSGKKLVWIYGGIVILVFAMFYPVISGMWINENSARLWLRWLSGWQII